MIRLVEGIKKDYSIIALIIANLVPLVGMLFWGWTLLSVLIFYWLESAVIGIFNVPKMLLASTIPKGSSLPINQRIIITIILKFFLAPFFLMHYGAFMMVHLLFIFLISSLADSNLGTGIITNMGQAISPMVYPALFLFASHGISFFVNFIGKEEYKKESIKNLMAAPYKRITVMHLTLLLGGFLGVILSASTGSKSASLGIISFFIILKIYFDIKAHNIEHSETFIKPLLQKGK